MCCNDLIAVKTCHAPIDTNNWLTNDIIVIIIINSFTAIWLHSLLQYSIQIYLWLSIGHWLTNTNEYQWFNNCRLIDSDDRFSFNWQAGSVDHRCPQLKITLLSSYSWNDMSSFIEIFNTVWCFEDWICIELSFPCVQIRFLCVQIILYFNCWLRNTQKQ